MTWRAKMGGTILLLSMLMDGPALFVSHAKAQSPIGPELLATTNRGELVAIDLSNPANPSIAGIWGDRYAHDVYVTNYDDCPYSGRSGPCEIAFVFTGGSGLWIADVTNKSSMTTIGTLTYPHQAYCHQGWLTDDKRHILFGDEVEELSSYLT